MASFNLDTLAWEPLAIDSTDSDACPRARAGHSACEINTRLYIWSGRDGYRKAWNNQVCCKDLWFLETDVPSAPPGKCQLLKPTTNSLELSWPACPTAEAYILQIQKVENYFKTTGGLGAGVLPPPPPPQPQSLPTVALAKPTVTGAVLSVQSSAANVAVAAAAGLEASLLRMSTQIPQQQVQQQQQQIELNQALNSINEAKLVIQPPQSQQQPLVLTPATVKGSNSIFIGQLNGWFKFVFNKTKLCIVKNLVSLCQG